GTAIGWGSLVVTCNTYLASAGILGTVIGLAVGMAVILVISHNLQYMITQNPDAGGIYSFAKKSVGHDYGFLAAWFLFLTYTAILWANITSVPLFARYFIGDIFRFGGHYHIFGYEVWLGEALISMLAVFVTGIFCINSKKLVHIVIVIAALLFTVGFTVCTIWALAKHGETGFSYEPSFIADSSSISQIARVAVISPWAFIGFENVAHFSEEYNFHRNRIRRILTASVVLSTVLYIFVSLLSVSAYPPEYASWLEYIQDMGNLSGIKAVPSFYAISYYLGSKGVTILMLALMGAIVTSLIGNTIALSRLLYAAGRDGDASSKFAVLNEKGVPQNAIYFVILITFLVPFLGRTAIGWIVDVTTLGATIIYLLLSYAIFRYASKTGHSRERTTGIAGIVLMGLFILMLLLPNLLSFEAMAPESYILFDIWAILGLIYFRRLVVSDSERRYGRSVIVWIILLMFVLFASMMWVTSATKSVTNEAMQSIHEYYREGVPSGMLPADDMEFLQMQSDRINDTNALFTVASFVVFMSSALIILHNYRTMRSREEEHSKQLILAESKATTDHLTGVKNRFAYDEKEEEINARIKDGSIEKLAVVVCDINDLKLVNDLKGHAAGDLLIRNACRMICSVYKHSPVYRMGGDEFAIVLEGEDFDNRNELLETVRSRSISEREQIGSTVAAGMSDYAWGYDATLHAVFTRADRSMYVNKVEIKESQISDED
ncbi:MAG: amino acid permease, partial [Firmicutes bacterium]|nr:amino acid permease [Bacillota bacterium]